MCMPIISNEKLAYSTKYILMYDIYAMYTWYTLFGCDDKTCTYKATNIDWPIYKTAAAMYVLCTKVVAWGPLFVLLMILPTHLSAAHIPLWLTTCHSLLMTVHPLKCAPSCLTSQLTPTLWHTNIITHNATLHNAAAAEASLVINRPICPVVVKHCCALRTFCEYWYIGIHMEYRALNIHALHDYYMLYDISTSMIMDDETLSLVD